MSRLGGAASQFYSLGRSKPKIASLSFWRPLRDSRRVAVVEPPVPYLESTAPPPPRGVPARETSQLGLPAVLVFGSPTVYLLHHLHRTATVMPRQKVTADGLDARTEANGYQRGAHWEEDSRRDSNKHEDKTKKNYRAKLVRNLYNGGLRLSENNKTRRDTRFRSFSSLRFRPGSILITTAGLQLKLSSRTGAVSTTQVQAEQATQLP